ncbi:hypothetical protein [Rubritalea tangerina]|uniref:hypothetical protein n=1 Tax=Rubritalea tangerina TaxID=430798 RepID=UPI00361A8D5F
MRLKLAEWKRSPRGKWARGRIYDASGSSVGRDWGVLKCSQADGWWRVWHCIMR